jgi:hypothetical protein
MTVAQAFQQFLSRIHPEDDIRKKYRAACRSLRQSLQDDGDARTPIVTTFLHGSHRRATAVRSCNGTRTCVDLAVLLDLSPQRCAPGQAQDQLRSLLRRYYPGAWSDRGRSLTVRTADIDLVLVVTTTAGRDTSIRSEASLDTLDESPPSDAEAHAWRMDPLLVPNRVGSRWEQTHPLAQLAWTRAKDATCNGCFTPVVRTVRWWRQCRSDLPDLPSGYPLERLVGDCCPDGIRSVAEGVAATFAALGDKYAWHARTGRTPFLANVGVPDCNVLARVTPAGFAAFVELATAAASVARRAFHRQDVAAWHALFGEAFPPP